MTIMLIEHRYCPFYNRRAPMNTIRISFENNVQKRVYNTPLHHLERRIFNCGLIGFLLAVRTAVGI
jgi:hypothetical protein